MKGEESVDDVTEADRPALLKDGVCSRSVFMRDCRAWEPVPRKRGVMRRWCATFGEE